MNGTDENVPRLDLQKLREQLGPALSPVGLDPIDSRRIPNNEEKRLRIGSKRPPTGNVELVSLSLYPDGVLRWDLGITVVPAAYDLRRAGRAALPMGQVVQQFVFERIEHNKIGDALKDLDAKLSPERGLRYWKDGHLLPFAGPLAAGKSILLFIHGTFSNCNHLFEQFGKTADQPGYQLLAAAAAAHRYDYILTFDHPTVGVSPMLNAFDLAALLRPAPASVDIICHSRGGLVTRWFLEGFSNPAMKSRAVMVGATLGGTSLAAPHRLRSSLNYLANVGEILGRLAGLVCPHPFIVAAGGLIRIVTSVTKMVSNSSVLDAAITMLPGLNSQSRVGNNQEILALQKNIDRSRHAYFAVTSDFKPKDVGWNFLQYFSQPVQRLAGFGADLIFEKPNDLIVETESMLQLASNHDSPDVKIQEVKTFSTNSKVYHTNYFQQKETIDFIREKFEIK